MLIRILRTIARRYMWTTLVNALAAVGLLLQIAEPRSLVAWVPAALALALSVWRGRFRRVVYATARVLIVAGLTIAYADATGDLGFLAGATSLLLIMLTLQEPTIRRLPRPTSLMAHMPGHEFDNPRQLSTLTLYRANVVMLLLFAAAAVLTLSPLVVLIPAIILVLVVGFTVAESLLRWSRRTATTDELRTHIETYAPSYLIHYSGPPRGVHQVTMWLPYFDRVGENYMIVVRERHSLRRLAAATTSPVVLCSSLASLDAIAVPSLRAAFYVNNGMKNTHFVRFAQYTHVQILHGDSDKPPSFSPVTALYDKVFVAGQAGIDRYEQNGVHIPAEKFEIVGRPQVEPILTDPTPIAAKPAPVVLYAPTWRGNYADSDFCSLPVARQLISGLISRGATVIFRPHPFSTTHPESRLQIAAVEELLAADTQQSGRQHIWGATASTEMSINDCFNASDAMLSDVSSVVSDYLHSEKPFAVTDLLDEGAGFVTTFPLARASYVIKHDLSNVDDVFASMFGADPLASRRHDMQKYYLGEFPAENYAEVFVDAVRALVRTDAPEHTPHFTPEND